MKFLASSSSPSVFPSFVFTYQVYEPIAGNYYPLTAAMYVQDAAAHKQLAVLTDRSQGGASLKSGEMEVRQGEACVQFFCVLFVSFVWNFLLRRSLALSV